MKKQISKILTDGLLAGYAGKGVITPIKRGEFSGKASDYKSEDAIYHDEWFVPTHLGGGQELVKIGEQMFTRVYSGGTPPLETLQKIGVEIKEVSAYLKKKLVELTDKTRLFADCKPSPDGDWQYEYKILLDNSNIGVTVASESITYKGTLVHLHPFILSAVL